MSTPVTCPQCRHTHRVEFVLVGQLSICPKCQHSWAPLPQPAKSELKKTVRILDAQEIRATTDATVPVRTKKKKPYQKLEPPRPLVLLGMIAGLGAMLGLIALVSWLVFRPTDRPSPIETAKEDRPASNPEPEQPLAKAIPPAANPVAVQPVAPLKPATLPGVAAAGLGAPAGGATVGGAPAPEVKLNREQLYQRALRSTTFIESPGGYGSGSLIHLKRKLVLTNFHVVGNHDRVVVYFPSYEKTGGLITAAGKYLKQQQSLGFVGKVIERNPTVDLALIELEKVPDTANVIPFATLPAQTGAEVISIGASGIDTRSVDQGSLWRLSSGAVRGRVKTVYESPEQRIHAMFLETQKPTNPGDSGGPTVNEFGELVGVVCWGKNFNFTGRGKIEVVHLVEYDIDLTEVQEFVKAHAVKQGWAWTEQRPFATAPTPLPPSREMVIKNAMTSGTADQIIDAIRELKELKQTDRNYIPMLLGHADHPEAKVRTSVDAALKLFGDPLPEDSWCLSKALKDGGPFARQYALKFYSVNSKLPEEHLSAIVALVQAGATDDRILAMKILGRYGGECRKSVLQPLAISALEQDPGIASTALATLATIGPYHGDDFRWLTDRLNSENLGVKKFVITQVSLDAPDAETAIPLIRSFLIHADTSVRTTTLSAITRWRAKAIPYLSSEVLLPLLNDKDDALRLAAIKATGDLTMQPALSKLRQIYGSTARIEDRNAAAESLIRLDLSVGSEGNGALNELLKCEPFAVRIQALEKLILKMPLSVEQIEAVSKSLGHEQATVRVAALKVLGAAGEPANSQTEQVVKLVRDSEKTVSVQARTTLVQFGPKAAVPFARLLDQNLPDDEKIEVCKSLGSYENKLPDGVAVQLMTLAEKEKTLRETISTVAVAVNTDAVSLQIRKFTAWHYVGTNKLRKSLYTPDCQQWAFDTLGQLDPTKLSDTERKKLMDGLYNQSDVDPDSSFRKQAGIVYNKLKSRLKTPGK
jgi:S1-C subfamily serine protease/HEAT repeat protein